MAQNLRNELFDKLHKLPISRSGDRAPRVDLKLRVNVHVEGRMTHLETTSVNISRSGILVSTPKSNSKILAVGQKVKLEIDLDKQFFSEQIRATATIVRHVESVEKPAGYIYVAMSFSFEA